MQDSLYTALFERWQQERATAAFLPLRDTFIRRLRAYIEQVTSKAQAEKISKLQRSVHEAELTNLRFMLNSLLQCRIQKILTILLTHENIDYDLLTRQERRFVDQVTRSLQSIYTLESDLFAPLDTESSSKVLLVRFLEDWPQIVGVDLRTYGPFKADDLATLPLENARVIIRRNGAEPVAVGVDRSEGSQDREDLL